MDVWKIDVEFVFVWVELLGLDIKFWGLISLMKIIGIIGKLIKKLIE